MNLVLKKIPHGKISAVTGFLPSMEREWAVGHRLALYCTTATGGALFMPRLELSVLSQTPDSAGHWLRGRIQGITLDDAESYLHTEYLCFACEISLQNASFTPPLQECDTLCLR